MDRFFKILESITRKAKMNWFMLSITENKEVCVSDLEEGTELSLKEGVSMVCEGMTSYPDYGLTNAEIRIFEDGLKLLEIEIPSHLKEFSVHERFRIFMKERQVIETVCWNY